MYIYAFSAKKNVIDSIYKEESYTKHVHAITCNIPYILAYTSDFLE